MTANPTCTLRGLLKIVSKVDKLYNSSDTYSEEHNDAEIQALVRYMKSHESYSGQRNEQ